MNTWNKTLSIGSWEFISSRSIRDTSVLLVAGGRAPASSWFSAIARSFRHIWCADSGLEVCRQSDIIPEYIVGDEDSSSSESLKWALQKKVQIKKYPVDKDYTDLQLALKHIGEAFPHAEVLLTGCWGGRVDHTWSNIFSAIWAEKEWGLRVVCLCDDKEALFILDGPEQIQINFHTPLPQTVSLLALEETCENVSIHGTRWELEKTTLHLFRPYSISNRLANDGGKSIEVEVDKGRLAVYLYWAE
ncbi:thiamine diphosphokinase [Aminobacterium mobile]|jgi:thiamine pyrophosphokinase|uniref:thiamine diphosphokinase n=1 Tax=Aminobacterium mobile TaxID=81467 RepID=UPI000464EA5E|nr:thiamine diphosphokinase [Aminobacterium mobile]